MALVFADRVKDSSTTTGTGTFTISGTAATGYQTFNSGIGVGNTCYYCIAGQAGSTDPTEWEVGLGTLSTATTITRSAGNVLSGSSGAGTLVNFSAGTKDVFVTSPALWATSPSFTGTVGVASQLNLTNASNWNLYASGAGANYMAGQLSIGTTTLTNGLLTVNATQSNSAYQFYVSGTNSNASTTIGSFYNSLSLTGASATTVYGINNVTSYNANAATAIYGISSTVNIGAAALGGSTIGVMSSYVAQTPAVNGSVTSTITSAIQFYATAISSSKITNAYAFYGNQYASGSTNNWNLYVPGTSANYLVGQLVIGPSTTLTNGFFAITSTSANAAYSIYIAGTNSSSAGTLGSINNQPTITGASATVISGLKNSPTITGAAATSIYGIDNSFAYNANAATNIYGTSTVITIGAAALGGSTISSMWSYIAQPPLINSSATTAITNVYQFRADAITQGSAQTISNAYAFYGNQASSGATSTWNLYMAGSAKNYLAGSLGIGTTTIGSLLTVAGPISVNSPTSVGTATYSQLTSDSELIVTYSGTTTLTLLSAASYPGQILWITAGSATGTTTVISASSNVVPINSTTAGTAIMASNVSSVQLQSNGTNWVVISQTTPQTKITTFTSNGTYTPAVGAQFTRVILIGAGGGGGGGIATASGTSNSGGSGGGGGALVDATFQTSSLGASVTVTIGQGGAGGTGSTTATGNPGVAGGVSSFGTFLNAYGGGFGFNGQSNANSGGGAGAALYGTAGNGSGTSGGSGFQGSQGGGFGSGASGSGYPSIGTGGGGGLNGGGGAGTINGGYLSAGPSGGASGGGAGGGNAATPGTGNSGGNGGGNLINFYGGSGGTAGGGAGGQPTQNTPYSAGRGGGGGGSGGASANGGNGGNGGLYGGGGGGGGSCASTHTGGTGGTGANGICWVIEYF